MKQTICQTRLTSKCHMAYFLSKLSDYETPALPGWTDFNTKMQKASGISEISNIGCLPVIDASLTNLSTVNTILKRSLTIADQLSLIEAIIAGYGLSHLFKGSANKMKRCNVYEDQT